MYSFKNYASLYKKKTLANAVYLRYNEGVHQKYSGKDEYMQAHNLPSFITEKYIVSELIYTSDRTETYKLYARNDSNDSDNKAYLLKVRCKEEKTTVDAEENVLKKLEEQQIDAPRFVERVDDSDKCYLIRDYVEGRTLQEYAQMR